MKRESARIVVCALLLSLSVVLVPVPYGIFLLPTLFAACCFGYGMSFYTSSVFGLVSLSLTLLIGGTSPVVYYFYHYPWIPLVPRLFVGIIAHSVFLLMTRLIKPKTAKGKILPIAVTAAAGTLSNTILVGACILLVNKLDAASGITVGYLLINGGIEIAVTALLLPPIVLSVQKSMPRLFGEINTSSRFTKKQKSKSENEVTDPKIS